MATGEVTGLGVVVQGQAASFFMTESAKEKWSLTPKVHTVFVDDRKTVQARLKEAGIPTAVHYPVPLNQQPAYRDICCPDCTPNADQVAKAVLSVPMHPGLSSAEQDRVRRCL